MVIDDGTVEDNIRQLEESDEDSDNEGDEAKRRRLAEDGTSAAEPASPGTKRRRKRRQFRQYYTGSFYGASTSSLVYTLAQQLNKADRELLWSVSASDFLQLIVDDGRLAIVGTTEMFMLDRISRDKYNLQVSESHQISASFQLGFTLHRRRSPNSRTKYLGHVAKGLKR